MSTQPGANDIDAIQRGLDVDLIERGVTDEVQQLALDALGAVRALAYQQGYMEGVNQPRLSAREVEDLELLSLGLTTKEAAVQRCVSPETVKTNRSSAFRKLGALNGVHAVRLGIERGWIGINPEPSSNPKVLSPIELKVLDKFSQGLNANKIAKELGRSPETIKTRRSDIFEKLGVKGTSAAMALAVRRAFEMGILPPPILPGPELADSAPIADLGSEVMLSIEDPATDGVISLTEGVLVKV